MSIFRQPDRKGPMRIITVRMDQALHERLRQAAWREQQSMNVFCERAIESAALASELMHGQSAGAAAGGDGRSIEAEVGDQKSEVSAARPTSDLGPLTS